jgi:hypothetical protein
MGVMSRVGILNYSVSGECRRGSGSGVNGIGWQGKEGRERRREWKNKAEKIFWGQKGKWSKREVSS